MSGFSFLKTFEKDGTYLYGHPVMNRSKGIEFSNGSLGMGLSLGIGVAIAGRKKNLDYKVYVLMGDGECNEGSVWESVLIANAYKLDNLVVIIDRNFRQANLKTVELIPLESLQGKFSAFGWETLSCNGHNIKDIHNIFEQNFENVVDKPTVIIANTTRGNGIPLIEDNPKYWFGDFNEKELAEFNKILDNEMER